MSIDNTARKATLSRRSMLARLGLAVPTVYAAPVLLRLGDARASSFSRSRSGLRGRRRPRRSFS